MRRDDKTARSVVAWWRILPLLQRDAPAGGNASGDGVSDQERVPNRVLRRIREQERQESRSEFAAALAAKAAQMGIALALRRGIGGQPRGSAFVHGSQRSGGRSGRT